MANFGYTGSLKTTIDGLVGARALAQTAIAVKSAAYNASPNEIVPVDATSAAVIVTLPNAPADKTRVTVKKIDSSTNLVTVATAGSDVFNKAGGSVSIPLALTNQSATLQYNAATAIWYLISSDIPLSQLDARYPTSAGFVSFVDLSGNAIPGDRVRIVIDTTVTPHQVSDIVVVTV